VKLECFDFNVGGFSNYCFANNDRPIDNFGVDINKTDLFCDFDDCLTEIVVVNDCKHPQMYSEFVNNNAIVANDVCFSVHNCNLKNSTPCPHDSNFADVDVYLDNGVGTQGLSPPPMYGMIIILICIVIYLILIL
jgi:hypothetical protein